MHGAIAFMHQTGLQVRQWQACSRVGHPIAEFGLGLLADVEPHRLTPIHLHIWNTLRAWPASEAGPRCARSRMKSLGRWTRPIKVIALLAPFLRAGMRA
jgi:hypothetical protein